MCIEQLGIVCIDIEQLGSVYGTVKICLDGARLQAPVHGILPPTTATVGYVMGLRKLSADSFSLVLKMAASLQPHRQLKLDQAVFLL